MNSQKQQNRQNRVQGNSLRLTYDPDLKSFEDMCDFVDGCMSLCNTLGGSEICFYKSVRYVRPCRYGEECRHVVQTEKYRYDNTPVDRPCTFLHPGESEENYEERTGRQTGVCPFRCYMCTPKFSNRFSKTLTVNRKDSVSTYFVQKLGHWKDPYMKDAVNIDLSEYLQTRNRSAFVKAFQGALEDIFEEYIHNANEFILHAKVSNDATDLHICKRSSF